MGPNLSKPTDETDALSDHSSSQASFEMAKPQPTRAERRCHPPHIIIQPWDGSDNTRRVFVNQLQAYVYFNASSFSTSSPANEAYDHCIWALSYFCGDASEVVGECITKLVGQKELLDKNRKMETEIEMENKEHRRPGSRRGQRGLDPEEWEEAWENYKDWRPVEWETLLEYTKTVSRKVEVKRKQEERKCNRWPEKELKLAWRALVHASRWLVLAVILLVVVLCLILELNGSFRGNEDIVWVAGEGVRPNRGRFVARNRVEFF